MLNGMIVQKITGGGKIYFPDKKQREKANWHHYGEGRMPKREFFDLSKKNISYISDRLQQKLKQAVRG
jgi:phage gpG-like protein